MRSKRLFYPVVIALVALVAVLLPGTASAQQEATAVGGDKVVDQQDDLAKKLQNPVANLIRVPLQSNWDWGIGPANAMRYLLNVQPIQLQVGPRFYADRPAGGPDWGLRFTVTFLFPK